MKSEELENGKCYKAVIPSMRKVLPMMKVGNAVDGFGGKWLVFQTVEACGLDLEEVENHCLISDPVQGVEDQDFWEEVSFVEFYRSAFEETRDSDIFELLKKAIRDEN